MRYKKIKSHIDFPDPDDKKEKEEPPKPQKKVRPTKPREGAYTSSCTRYIFPAAVENKANAEWIQPHQHAVAIWKDISGKSLFWAVTCKSHEPRDIKDAMHRYRYSLSPEVMAEKRKALDRLKEKISILDDYCLEDLDDCSTRTKVNVEKLKAYTTHVEGRVIEITPREAERYLSKQGQALPKMVKKVSQVGPNPQGAYGLDDHEPMARTIQQNIGTNPSDRDSMMGTNTGSERSRTLKPECTNPGGSENMSYNSISLEIDIYDTIEIPRYVGEQHQSALAEKQKKTPNPTDAKELPAGNPALEVMEEIIRDIIWLGDSAESLEAVALFDIEGVEHQLMKPRSQKHSNIGTDL